MFQIERMGGASVVAAMKVPEAEFERVAEQVNSLPEVAHNYRREHAMNMWFVLATETCEGIAAAVSRIEALTGLPVFPFFADTDNVAFLRDYLVDARGATFTPFND